MINKKDLLLGLREDGLSVLPLSAAQQGLWFSQQLHSHVKPTVFKMAEYMEIFGDLDIHFFEVAIRQTIDEATSYHSVFVDTEQGPRQLLDRLPEWQLRIFDFSNESDPEAVANQWMQTDMSEAFDLLQGPLFSFALIRLNTDRFYFYQCGHHIITDGYSAHIFARRMADIYTSLTTGSELQTSAFDPFANLIESELTYKQSSQFQRDRDYWLSRLENRPDPVSLAGRMADCSEVIYQRMYLPSQANDALRQMATDCQVTLAQLLTALISIYLRRISGQDDLLMGFPVTGRAGRTLRYIPGMVTNVVPLRLELTAEMTLTECLSQVKRQVHGAVKHQRYRGEDLRTDLNLIPGQDQLYATMINIIPSNHDICFGDAKAFVHNLLGGPIEDLSISVFDRGPADGLELSLGANSALYDVVTLEQHLQRLSHFLTEAVNYSQATVREYPLLSEAERREVVEDFNATRRDYPEQFCVHSLFEALAMQDPEAPAVVCDGQSDEQSLSYGELNARANCLAHVLQNNGVSAGDHVVVHLARSAMLIVAELAILKCGAVYVPVDPDAPAERLNFVLSDCAARLMLSGESEPQTGDANIRIIALTEALVTQGSFDTPDIAVNSGSAAYVMYTSGSTGQPKGVVVPHRAIVRLVINNGYLDLSAQDRVAFAANPAFDATTLEVWAPLLNGGAVVVVRKESLLDPASFADILIRQQVSILWLTVGLFNQYAGDIGHALQGLRYLMVGGDVLDPAVIRRVLQHNPPQHLLNGYGPTETTTFALTYDIKSVDDEAQSIPLGRPIGNTSVYILDAQGQPVPKGVSGEIYIGGDGVALGYLGQPALTEERFLADPFSSDPQARMYKSGDLGRWRDDGCVEFLGRNDFQVKIRGYRIELGEIEAALQRCDGIQDVLVLATEGAAKDKRLVAYYTLNAGAEVTAEHLKTQLNEQLPVYMVPAAYMALDQFPLTPNGKVDRKALPSPDESAFAHQVYEKPQGKAEETLAEIWLTLLGVEQVGRQDNFFELGGHSLLAVQLIEQLRHKDYHLSVKELFNQPTLKALGVVLAEGSAQQKTDIPPNLIPQACDRITPEMLPLVELTQQQIDRITAQVSGGAANVQDIYPLAPLQEGMLFHHVLDQDGDPYVTRLIQAFAEPAQMKAFTDAFQAVIRRHDILRTSVAWEGLPTPVQVVWRDAPLSLTTLEIESGDVAAELQQRFDPAHTRMNISHAPMIEAYQAADPANGRWLLCLLMHHMCNDHTTLELLLEEVQAHLLGQADQLAEPLPFRNFVAQACLNVDRQAQEDYFRTQLADIDEPSAPFGLADVQGDSQQIREQHFVVEDELTQRLREQARTLGVSTASLFHLAWGLVVRATTGRDDVVFGTVLFGRMSAGEGANRMLGMFLNTLPLRLSLGATTVGTMVQQTHQLLAELLDYEHAPLALAQQCSGLASQTPLFSSLLNYRYQGGSEQLGLEALKMDIVFTEERTNYPVTLCVNDDPVHGFSLDVQVDQRIGCERVGLMMLEALKQLTGALASAPETVIESFDLLPDAERQRVLHDFNRTDKDFPDTLCIHELFESRVEQSADAVAVICDNRQLTFRELNEEANRLAHWLTGQGVRPDSRVAVSLERSCDLVVALVAILKSGGAYVPLDPGYPEDRLTYMMEDSRPVALITTQTLLPRLGDVPAGVTVIDMEGALRPWENCAAHNLPVAELGLTSRDMAYVIYTSGSTGKPKGVMNEHRGVVNRLRWMKDDYGFGPDDVVLQKTPFSFDVSVWEFFCPIWAGATLVMAKPEGHKDPDYLRRLIEMRQVSILHFVPPMLLTFLESLPEGACPSLRLIFCSGEALSAAAVRKTYACLPHVELHNLYGPTEAAVDVTAWHCPRTLTGDRISIGAPVDNTRMYVLDEQGHPVAMGVSGELYIGGVQVARGYLNRPELTAERFLDDPFAPQAGARMYRTGDVGRWLADGTIEYQGRNDDQVKIRGFRIELGEIASALQSCQGIQEAVVIARGTQEKHLVAYYVSGDNEIVLETLKAELGERLPEHMVPAAYVALAQMPLTPNGKVNRKVLPAPDEAAFIRRAYEAPQGDAETTLAEIWQTLLGISRVGRHDNFFELGGHSLLAIRLIESLRQEDYHLTVKTLFDQPSLAELAAQLADTPAKSEMVIPPNLIPADCKAITPDMLPLVDLTQAQIDTVAEQVTGGMANIQDIYPLAPLQEGILFHHMLEQEGDPYVNPMILAFDNKDSVDAFVTALQSVINRHDILRTAMVWDGLEEPVQVVWREARLPVATLEIESDDVIATLQQRFGPALTRLDVSQAPLMMAYLVNDPAQNRWLLCLLNHHLNSDHTTLELLVEEVSAYLQGQFDQLPTPLPFRNFVAQTRLGADKETQAAFFRERLGDIDEPCAPFGLLEAQNAGQQIQEHHLPLNETLAVHLREQARKLGVSTASLFHLAWGMVLRATTGRDDIVFGTVLFGRMAAGDGAHRALGMFLNTLPIRLSLGDLSVGAAVQRTHESLAELLEYEHASLVLAQQCSGMSAQMPLFSSLLNYRYDGGSEQLEGSNIRTEIDVVYHREQTNYPISVSVNDHIGQGFSLDILVDERLDGERIAQMMAAAVSQLVETLAAAPEHPVSRLTVLSAAERHRVLYELNETRIGFPVGDCIQELFERQADIAPEAVAVVFGNQQLTYGQLNIQANQLAHWLIEQGVRPDSRVAVLLERSCDLIVSLLAIFKAGGAYVPMDPNYPQERLAYMLEDSAPELLITTAELCQRVGTLPERLSLIEIGSEVVPWRNHSQENIAAETINLTASNLAYIIYTSGSTGQPKGVMIEHQNLANLVHWHNRAFDIKPGSCVSSVSGLGFDATVWEIWPPLCVGAYLVLPESSVSRDPDQLLAWWMAQPIEVGFLSTPIAELAFSRHLQHPTLRALLVGGDRLNRHPSPDSTFRLVNNYGPTETTVVATSGVVQADDVALHIGQPIANTTVYILDGQGQPAPAGVTGELYIGGAGVARGYLNRPDLTESRFLADPFAGQPGARMYRTGDLGRWLPDGTIEYQGRNDDQVKLRGFRIELGEIESCIRGYSGIENVVVQARTNSAGLQQLVAYYVGAAGAETLREHVAAQLPEYMVPAAWVALDNMPLTANGKLDRKALPEPDENAFVRQAYEAPQGQAEMMLAEIWQSLLGVEQAGRHDNFFELGGHSLLAIKLIEQLRQQGYHLAVKTLFDQPTLAALAAEISGDTTQHHIDVPPNLIPAGCEMITPEMLPLVELTTAEIDVITSTVTGGSANIQDIYPLVPLQEGILFHHLLALDGDPYVNRFIQVFPDEAAIDTFIRALQPVINRHDILRTAIVWEGLETPVQVVWREAPMSLQTLDLEPNDDMTATLQAYFEQDHARMDVQRAPMIEAYKVADPANDRWLVCFLFHHLCNDHTTLELLVEEIHAHLRGEADRLPKPLPFRNFVAQASLGVDKDAQAAYFTELLGDIDEPCAPYGLLDVQSEGQQIQEFHVPLDDTLAQRIREQARKQSVSTASLFHLAWGMVLRATTGRDDVVFGTVLFGRMDAGDGADRVLGMFLNTLPLRLSLGDLSVKAAVQRTHEGLAELLEYEHASLVLAQQCSGISAQVPLFSSLLNYRYDGGSRQLEDRGIPGDADIIYSREQTNYPISVSINDHVGQGFSLDILTDERLCGEQITAMMTEAVSQLINALVAKPDCAIARVGVLPEKLRRQVLSDFNATRNEARTYACVHHLFEAQAQQYPAAVALISDERQLTYGELNAQANQLAHYLCSLGVGPEKRVALCFDRGPAFIVAMLATLKAGGAYVPMDPAYPAERLQYMLTDSMPDVVLTDGALEAEVFFEAERLCPHVIRMENEAYRWAGLPESNLRPAGLSPDNLAYIIYTSGSTGKPKGVMVGHDNLTNLVHWHNQRFEVQAGTCVSAVAGLGFDATVWEIWPPLCVGARLTLPSLAISRDPDQLLAWWIQQPIEVGFLSTPIAELAFSRKLEHPTLRTLLVGGDRLKRHPAPDATFTLVNNYGPTETTVVATSGAIRHDDEILHIGGPIANTAIYILDSHRQPVPIGVTGEIYIGGAGVARGYLNRPDLTEESFLDDPFSGQVGVRMYRTGDLGCWLADGTIEYQGRNDDQVKIRGFRIELGEIETCIRCCAGVDDAVVQARQSRTDDKQLVAYYIGQADPEELRESVSRQLPDYMVPVAWIALDAMPLTANGKLDRRALPEPADDAFVRRAYEAPQGEAETALAEIWQSVLGVEQVGRYDSFFELGGHSLLAVRMVSEAQKRGLTFDLATLMATPTLHLLAGKATSAQPAADRVLAFRETGNQTPLFIVPEFSGELLYAPALTASIDENIPVYGLSAPDRMQPSLKTYQQMAARYVKMIRRTQPQGPYRLFGWSSGGVLAYEVAAQLIGQDQTVEFLGMLDSWVPGTVEKPDLSDEELTSTLARAIVQYLVAHLPEQETALPEQGDWQDYYHIADQLACLPPGWDEHYFSQMLIHQKDFIRMDYQALPLAVHIDMIAAQDSPSVAPYLGWDQVLPTDQIRLVTVPGEHEVLVMHPYVTTTGAAISQAITLRAASKRQDAVLPAVGKHTDTKPVEFKR
ncbi:non-ribosomal peptide synthetase [Vibrio mangrovi]|uniref:Non-ribosomal peptide synthetase n=1 Tax=Vibrio mangrovi TaxID=474394 RepID=A0A1Y6J0W7_9VIBR|nr:non-ribosomal peptide synthetase [Vibrio mangrovi]MDW6005256.1 non-ribosomal peptide synthetase [Vibrio mangrovi]SMS02881.1 Tyrocidine synthase 3 [Vibrio mangrovi]